jgi:hypothetical protein
MALVIIAGKWRRDEDGWEGPRAKALFICGHYFGGLKAAASTGSPALAGDFRRLARRLGLIRRRAGLAFPKREQLEHMNGVQKQRNLISIAEGDKVEAVAFRPPKSSCPREGL